MPNDDAKLLHPIIRARASGELQTVTEIGSSPLLGIVKEDATIDQLLEESSGTERTAGNLAGWIEAVITHRDYTIVRFRGWVSNPDPEKARDAILEFSFPPNDKTFLDELKRAQSINSIIDGRYYIGATTKNPFFDWVLVRQPG